MCKDCNCQRKESLPQIVNKLGEFMTIGLVIITIVLFFVVIGLFSMWDEVDSKLDAIHYCQKSLVAVKPNGYCY